MLEHGFAEKKNTKSTRFTSDIKTSGSWWWDSYLPCVDGRNTTGEVDKEGLGLPAIEPRGPAHVDRLPGVRYHRQVVGSFWSICRRIQECHFKIKTYRWEHEKQ